LLKDRQSKFVAILLGVLLFGTAYGMVSFYHQVPASMSEMIFTLAAFLATGFLFLRKSFYSSALAAVFSTTLFAATLIITEFAKMDFSTENPDVVFYEPLKSQALHALLIFVCLFLALLLWRAPSGWSWGESTPPEKTFAKATRGFFLVAALALAAVNVQGELITQAGYHSTEWLAKQRETYSGIDALWTMLGICSLIGTLRVYGARHKNFYVTLGILLAALFYFKLLRGERSTTFGFLIFLALLYYTISTSRFRGWIILALIPVAFVFLIAWANVRGTASEKGLWQSFSEGSSSTLQDIQEGSIAKLDRFPKVTWDLLETTFLYENGIHREGATYWNLIPQMTPSFVAEIIGYERPLSEPWILARYFQHGGGIFMVAEAYWNFGLAGVIGLAIILAWVCVGTEKLYRKLPPVLSYGYYGTVMIGAETVLVGVQSFLRGLEIGLLVTTMGWVLLRISQRGTPVSFAKMALGHEPKE